MPEQIPDLDQELIDELITRQQAQDSPLKQGIRSTFEGGVDAILGALGVGPDTQANRAGELLAVLPIGSPLRLPKVRATLHQRLKESTAGMSPHIQKAVGSFVNRYPRLAAHIQRIDPVDRAQPTSGALTPLARPLNAPRAVMQLNPNLRSSQAAERTLAHEGTHLSDMVRLAAKARQEGASPTEIGNPFIDQYNKSNAMGYWENPMEVKARVTRELREIPRQTPKRWELARERAMDKVRTDVTLSRDLGTAPRPEKDMVAELVRHAQATGKIPGLSPTARLSQVADTPVRVGTLPGTMPTHVTIPRGGSIELPTGSTEGFAADISNEEVMALIRQMLGR